MAILTFDGHTPQFPKSAWIADNATVTGQVTIGEQSSIWYQVVIRGDVNKIIIGSRTNIQDATIVHGSHGKQDTIIGDDVTIGHRAIIHGCEIGNNVVIGMGAIILDDAVIPDYCIIGAGALVPPGKKLDPGFVYVGNPLRKLKPMSVDMIKAYAQTLAHAYVANAEKYASIS